MSREVDVQVKNTRLAREDSLLRDCSCYFDNPGPKEPEESRDNDIEIMAELRKRFPSKKKMQVVWSLETGMLIFLV